MRLHYHRCKGWRRGPGRRGRPVYYMPMSRREVNERRLLYSLITIMALMIGALAMWAGGLV